MIEIKDKKMCCGCTACKSVCPKQCIKMIEDEEGFLYPQVDTVECINCRLCERVCPILNEKKLNPVTMSVIVRNKDEEVLMNSTSGGAFTAIATEVIRSGAVVYGAVYNEKFEVIHRCIETEDELHLFRGSKFVQSDLKHTYTDVKNRLDSGQAVLFSGTPCQVTGLKSFLQKEYDNLLCVDFVCRGVPSPKLWRRYREYIQNKYKSSICDVRFRNKTYGYHSSTMQIKFLNGKVYRQSGRTDIMMKAFVNEMCSRPSCEKCNFKSENRASDITMFDCKEYTTLTGKADDDKGYTAVFVHTNKGQQLLDRIKEQLIVCDADMEKLIATCGIMVRNSAKANKNRDAFLKLMGETSIEKAAQTYIPISILDKMIELSKQMLFKTGIIAFARKIKKKEEIKINE